MTAGILIIIGMALIQGGESGANTVDVLTGGKGRIRTDGTPKRTLDFESSAFDHSATFPGGGRYYTAEPQKYEVFYFVLCTQIGFNDSLIFAYFIRFTFQGNRTSFDDIDIVRNRQCRLCELFD